MPRCCVCQATAKEKATIFSVGNERWGISAYGKEEELTFIGNFEGNAAYICKDCHCLATTKIVVKCLECGSVTILPKSWSIYERLMEKAGTPRQKINEAMPHFFQQASVVFYPFCPACRRKDG